MESKKLMVEDQEKPVIQSGEMTTAEYLKSLGLEKAADNVEFKIKEKNDLKELQRKLSLAYEHYRFVTPDKIDLFNKELKAKTLKITGKNQWGNITTHDQGIFISLKDFASVPPQHALDRLKEAQDRKIFDSYEVFKIESIETVPDPILFGRIKDCEDRFFIDQWDNDVCIEDILKDNEG